MKTKFIVAGIILFIMSTFVVIVRPYNNVEFNAGTIYYQSYSQLYVSIRQYVRMLEDYNDTEDEVHLQRAMIKLDSIRDNITTFMLASQIDFRNTFINEKVVKTDFLTRKNLQQLRFNYHYSLDVLKQYLEDNKLDKITFQDFIHYNQLILSGLVTEDIGYNPETKEFRVVLDNSKIPILEEGLTGLEEIIERGITPSIELISTTVDIKEDSSTQIGITSGEKKGEFIRPISLSYNFALKNTGNRTLGTMGNIKDGIRVSIEPNDKLIEVTKEVMGVNIFSDEGRGQVHFGMGRRGAPVLRANEEGNYTLNFEIGAIEENPEIMLVPPQEQKEKLLKNALEARLVIYVGDGEIAKFDLGDLD